MLTEHSIAFLRPALRHRRRFGASNLCVTSLASAFGHGRARVIQGWKVTLRDLLFLTVALTPIALPAHAQQQIDCDTSFWPYGSSTSCTTEPTAAQNLQNLGTAIRQWKHNKKANEANALAAEFRIEAQRSQL